MTHTPLTKAEREELRRLDDQDRAVWTHDRGSVESQDPRALPDEASGFRYYMGSGAPLAAAARNALPRLLADLDAAEAERDEIKTALGVMGATRERALEVAGSQDELEERIDSMSRERDVALKGWSAAEAARDDAAAQRDRAESELDAERRMRVEAEAAAKRAESERDALKAKLADPRRVLIHETEVVATKEEIATLKARLADLSDADEELHTCRALVNATSENLSVDLERMVDDLAEANEKAALSGKDSHSWHELYKDTKAKLAACEAERDAQATELVDERDRAKAKLAAAESAHSELFLSGQVAELRAKLAALVAAVDTEIDNVDHENYPLCGVHDGSRLIGRHLNGAECTCGVQKIRNAIAAARGGA